MAVVSVKRKKEEDEDVEDKILRVAEAMWTDKLEAKRHPELIQKYADVEKVDVKIASRRIKKWESQRHIAPGRLRLKSRAKLWPWGLEPPSHWTNGGGGDETEEDNETEGDVIKKRRTDESAPIPHAPIDILDDSDEEDQKRILALEEKRKRKQQIKQLMHEDGLIDRKLVELKTEMNQHEARKIVIAQTITDLKSANLATKTQWTKSSIPVVEAPRIEPPKTDNNNPMMATNPQVATANGSIWLHGQNAINPMMTLQSTVSSSSCGAVG